MILSLQADVKRRITLAHDLVTLLRGFVDLAVDASRQ